ncbi:hypothetical protein GCM10010195_65750 [Kitasatospora griseola]|nr:hypothetical protein GCM10010195_65750 [Kitasatospora griseola]
MNQSAKHPKIALPLQARPVNRDEEWTGPAAQRAERGLEASRSRCASLPGIARQMCYQATYGVTT